MKVIFLGTPQFAVPSLQALINSSYQVVAVVLQPDKESGRGKKIKHSPVKLLAMKHNIPVYQFEKIRNDGVEILNSINADVVVTCAYGQILSQEILTMKKYGVINVHGSVLPKYRGSSPIQWTIINQEKTAGVSILKSDVGIDDGDVLSTREIELQNGTTSEELYEILSHIGADELVVQLNKIENGSATYTPQNHEDATKCKMLRKSMGKISFNNSVKDIVGKINGLNIWPVVEVKVEDYILKLYKALALSDIKQLQFGLQSLDNYKDGEVVVSSAKQGLVVKANDGFVQILEVQLQNSKRMDAKSFLNGKKINIGSVINE